MMDIKVDLTHIEDGVVQPVTYFWICWNCHGNVKVDQRTFSMLETRKLLWVKCEDCLRPPPVSMGLVA